jgi:hypothetical protein
MKEKTLELMAKVYLIPYKWKNGLVMQVWVMEMRKLENGPK